MPYKIINLFIALTAIPANLTVIRYLLLEKTTPEVKTVKLILLLLFLGILITSSINIYFYAFSELGLIKAHPLANIRSIVVNSFVSSTSWSFVFLIRKINHR